ncbi:MAG TPA: 4-carboxy-4-hydroxy-2-oxoadipate aldolase/oxaloacetate decarboxylase [Luteimonas sp.]|jgi:Demethylmenaquinone methyltransferase
MTDAIPSGPWTRAAALSTATLHEAAGRIGALPAAIKPLAIGQVVCGPALPVSSPPGDNLWLHRAIYEARPGEVLVVDPGEGLEFGYWGEVMAVAAQQRGIAGLVINGGVRDSQRMVELGFPVFAATVCIRGTVKDSNGAGSVGEPIRLAGTVIHRGDLVLGDDDGVVVVPAALVAEAVAESERRDQAEQVIFRRLRQAESTIEIYQLPDDRNRAR